MPTLEEILLSDQTNTEQVVNALKKALEEEFSSYLELPYNNLANHSNDAWINVFKALEGNSTITGLRIHDTHQLTNEAVEALITALKNNPYLIQLHFSHRTIQENPTSHFMRYKNNKEVITRLACLLENNSSLKELSLPIYKNVHMRIITNALEKNNTLEDLDISGTFITNEETMTIWTSLLKKNHRFTRFNMSKTSGVLTTPEIRVKCATLLTTALKENQNLRHFSYRENELDDEAVPLFISLLEKSPELTDLDLGDNQIGILHKQPSDKAVQALADVLKKNNRLISLTLARNRITKGGTEALARALEENNTLEKLDISEWNELDTPAFAKALKQNHTLKHLNIRNTKCDLEMLTEALENNKGLTELDLGWNVRNEISFQKLTDALQKNQNLSSLGFSYNHVRDEGLPHFINLLNHSPKLAKLDLSQNQIRLSDPQVLVNFLETNKTLTSLDLSENTIEIESIKALANALKNNSTITELGIKHVGGNIGYNAKCLYIDALQEAIEELLAVNNTITILKVAHPRSQVGSPSKESEDAYDRIQQALKRNQDLADKKKIKLVSEKIQEAQIVPSAVANIIAEYAGPSIPIGSPQRASKATVNTSDSKTAHLPHVSKIPKSSKANFKPLSLWARIKEWLGAKWGKLSNVISNAWNSLKNKLGLTPKKSHIKSSAQSKQIPVPLQTAPLPPEKETLISQGSNSTPPTPTTDLTQDTRNSKNQPKTPSKGNL